MEVLSNVRRVMGLGMVGAVLTLATAAGAGETTAEKKPAKPLPLESGGAPDNPSGVWLDVPMGPWGIAPIRPGRVSDYWLGVISQSPLPDSLRAHLKLTANQGLLVMDVAPNSPAAAAKLQRFDVLLKAGGRALGKVEDLMDALDASKGQKMTLEIVREGQARTVEVTPAKRPAEAPPKPRDWPADLFPGGAGPWEPLKEWLDRAQPGGPGTPLRFRFLRPGVLLPPGAPAPEPMPGDMTITITKQGNEPAKVVVTQGDKKWETTDDHLEKLPDGVRQHVQRLLDRSAIGVPRPGTLDRVPGAGGTIGPPAQPRDPKTRPDIGEEVAKMREQIRKAEQELQKGREEFRKFEQEFRELEQQIRQAPDMLKGLKDKANERKAPKGGPPVRGDGKPQVKGTAQR